MLIPIKNETDFAWTNRGVLKYFKSLELQAAKGSRLDGRVTVNQESNHNQRGGRGRGGRHQQGDRHVTNTDGELKAVVKNADVGWF